MSFDRSLYLKWIHRTTEWDHKSQISLIDHGLFATFIRDELQGFTVFEPRQFDLQFVARLRKRFEAKNENDFEHRLYLPSFLKHRAEMFELNKLDLKINYTSFLRLEYLDSRILLRDKVRVICVDDSPVILKLLSNSLKTSGFIDVISTISNSREAVSAITRHKPDLVTLDIQMPGLNGVELVSEVLSRISVPIIMISSLNPEEGSFVFDALNNGAFDYIQKPQLEEIEQFQTDLSDKILSAFEGNHNQSAKNIQIIKQRKKSNQKTPIDNSKNTIWCLGASTGGTQALTTVFTSLPAEIPPTLVVQHIPAVFSKSFANSLNDLCPFTVKEAEPDEVVQSNCVYIAPGGLQMKILSQDRKLIIKLDDSPPVNRFKPSVDYLFKHLASEISGFQIVAGLLTGMGKDGAEGLLQLKKSGATTFAQDEKSSAVYGMPRAAVELNAADKIVPLESVAQALIAGTQRFSKVK